MLTNYLLVAIRNIRRNITYSFINVFGLSLGVASCLLIFLLVRNELSYDSFHQKADRTYRVTMNALDFNPSVSMVVTHNLRTAFPELEHVSQFWFQQEGMVKVGENRYTEKAFAFGDDQFMKIFDYEWLAGDPQSALSGPNAVVLTESMARKYFGDNDPMGKVLNVQNELDLKVTGLIKDLPGNTHLPFNFIISFESIRKRLNVENRHFYNINGGYTYIVIPKNYSAEKLQKQLPAFVEKTWGKDIAKEAKLILQPMKDIHFDQRYLHTAFSPTTSRETYYTLGAVAFLIIIIACINFINLATAQAIRRAKEVGVRKVLGAKRQQLIGQCLGETSLLVMLSVIIGTLAAWLMLPQINSWLDVKIASSQLGNSSVLGLIALLIVSVILLAGLYPAFVQSAFAPIKTLKATSAISLKGLTLRKGLVVVQFAISQILIVGTLVVALQMDFFKNQDLGFDKEAVINFRIFGNDKRDVLGEKLSAIPAVTNFSFSSGAPIYNNSFAPFSSEELGVPKDDVTELKFIDEKYMDMFRLKLLAGQKVSKKAVGDTIANVVVNETLIHKLGIQDPQQAIGKHFKQSGQYSTIIGVVQDFQSESKHKLRRPCVLVYDTNGFYSVSVKLQSPQLRQSIERIEKEWSALFPERLFQYEFLDDKIAASYRQEEKVYTAFKLFSSIAILIGCLGLYGLIAFAAAQRTKEVGIRKVLGASIFNIVSLFAKESAILILIAFVIAAPVAYYVMHSWLENFAYQVSFGLKIFLMAIGVSFFIAALTIAYQAIKAAVANPVRSLRSE
ncbi:ABC transporter permease [Flavitalea sp.]|nr:ABC transporter permease [Flavitalea sp.]